MNKKQQCRHRPDNKLDMDLGIVLEKMKFKSKHGLDFRIAEWSPFPGFNTDGWLQFKVGTCHGLWRATTDAYEILAIENIVPGNGHLDDVLEWFENSCRRDSKNLRIRAFMFNPRFKKHLIEKRGFQACGKDDVIKFFKRN